MRCFYDTEFLEDGRTIELISIGMVTDDGREYYAVNADMPVDRVRAHPWLKENVWPHLPVRGQYTGDGRHEGRVSAPGQLDTDSTLVRPYGTIRDEVRLFLTGIPDVELWAWYGAYDHVALAQLFGRMVDLPAGIPMWTNDLKQECQRRGNPQLPAQESGVHNALADARHVKVMYEYLTQEA